jgi:hypothetical protein
VTNAKTSNSFSIKSPEAGEHDLNSARLTGFEIDADFPIESLSTIAETKKNGGFVV